MNTTGFIQKAKNVHQKGIKYDYSIVNYVNTRVKVKIICLEHGVFEQSPKNHLKGANCPLCSRRIAANKLRSNTTSFIEKAKIKHNGFFIYNKVEYIESKKHVIITCPKHGDFLQSPSEHLSGYGCMECGREKTIATHQKDTKWFIKRAIEVHGNYYDYTKTTYEKAVLPVEIICPAHGKFTQKASSHINKKHGCPKCIMSTGERNVMYQLEKLSKNYKYEYDIDVGNKMPLRYDFYVIDENILIEYDGEQHYRPVNFRGIDDKRAKIIHEKTKCNDKIKNKYAADNNIPLLRIPYTEFDNIEKIIRDFLH